MFRHLCLLFLLIDTKIADLKPAPTDPLTDVFPFVYAQIPPASRPAKPAKPAEQNYTYSTKVDLKIVGTECNYDRVLPSDFLFDFDKYSIRPEANGLLQKLKKHFATHKASQVHVYGHTDSIGSEQHNNLLSQQRASAIQRWLKVNTGVFAMALGMGEGQPLVPNENADGTDNPRNRQLNRRVTVSVVLYPNGNI